MRVVAAIVVTIKLLIAAPCVFCGFLIGVVGLGPEGPVPFNAVRFVALCVFAGGLAAAYPFSLILRPWRVNWAIVALSALPLLSLGVYAVLTAKVPCTFRMEDASDAIRSAIEIAICLLLPLLTLVDLLLSKSLQART